MPLVSEAAREYLAHLNAKGVPKGTARGRYNTVMKLVAVCGDKQTARVDARTVDKFFAAHPRWCAGTRNNQLSHLRLFFEWCRYRRFMHRDSDPTFGWKKLKYAIPPKQRIPVGEWPVLFSACETPLETITMATGLYLFLRASEQQRIQLKHVRLNELEIDIYRGKVVDYDTMPITAELEPYLRQHLTFMAEQGYSHPDHFLIYAKHPGTTRKGHQGFLPGKALINPVKPAGRPYNIVKDVLGRAGYATFGEGEHTLRRSGARAYFDSLVSQGYDGALREVMSMLGHKNSKNTEGYLGLEQDRFKRNSKLKGQPMFPQLQDATIVPIRREM